MINVFLNQALRLEVSFYDINNSLIDISAATAKTITVISPSGTSTSYTATFGTTGKIYYDANTTVLDTEGVWRISGSVTIDSKALPSTYQEFYVIAATYQVSGSYITSLDVQLFFGFDNIVKWSNIDNNSKAPDFSRIKEAITYAEEYVAGMFRDSMYTQPIGNADSLIKHPMAVLAGVWLFKARGFWSEDETEDPKVSYMKNLHGSAMETLKSILAGKLRLNSAVKYSVPTSPVCF